jgi:hypothetical protein
MEFDFAQPVLLHFQTHAVCLIGMLVRERPWNISIEESRVSRYQIALLDIALTTPVPSFDI